LDIFGIIAPQDDAWEHSLSDLPYNFFHMPTYARAWQAEVGLPVRLIVYRRGDSSLMPPIVLGAIEADRSRALKDAVATYGFPGPVMVAAPGVDPRRLVAEFLEALRTGLREIDCVSMFVRMQPLSPINELFQNAGATLVVQGPVVFVDLTQPMQELRASFRGSNRRYIKKLARAGFEPFQQERGWADFFYEIYLQSMERRNADSFYFFSRERSIACRRSLGIICALSAAGGQAITRGVGIANYFLSGTRVE
jgi:hypothetical protein